MKTIRTTSILATAVLAASAFVFVAAPAVATDAPTEASTSQSETTVSSDLSNDTIKEADKYVEKADGKLTFHASEAKSLSSDQKKQVQTAVDEWNSNLEDQPLQAQSGAKTIDRQDATRVSGKHGYIESHWWGLKIHLDSYLKGKVQAGAATGSAIAAGIGIATSETAVGGIAGGVVSAALAGAAGVIGLCSGEDGGVTLYEAATGGAPVCNPLA